MSIEIRMSNISGVEFLSLLDELSMVLLDREEEWNRTFPEIPQQKYNDKECLLLAVKNQIKKELGLDEENKS